MNGTLLKCICHKSAKQSGLEPIPVTKLNEGEIKNGVESFLIRYDKTLNEEQVGMILADLEDTGEAFLIRVYILIKKISRNDSVYLI